jgi:hypothetical protein
LNNAVIDRLSLSAKTTFIGGGINEASEEFYNTVVLGT